MQNYNFYSEMFRLNGYFSFLLLNFLLLSDKYIGFI
jgi:hypothetical protein